MRLLPCWAFPINSKGAPTGARTAKSRAACDARADAVADGKRPSENDAHFQHHALLIGIGAAAAEPRPRKALGREERRPARFHIGDIGAREEDFVLIGRRDSERPQLCQAALVHAANAQNHDCENSCLPRNTQLRASCAIAALLSRQYRKPSRIQLFAIMPFVFPRDEIMGALPAPVPLICAAPRDQPPIGATHDNAPESGTGHCAPLRPKEPARYC